ncbi:MAG: integration host factor subunit beta [Gemmatimonadetes bacterium]|nr:MAG: integration host factor subunit beta [Gemmatimonadota bacterium]
MTKAELVDQVSEETGFTKKDSADIVNAFLDIVIDTLSKGQGIEIRGFGSFKVKKRDQRVARNPRTGESVIVPAKSVPVFKPSKDLKSMVSQL